MCAVDWCSFSWQAFATLFTGLAAVGGAVFIGLRQHALAREQAKIADRQARTAENSASIAKLKLRSDLFEKRMEVLIAVNAYLKASLSVKTDKIWDVTPKLDEQLVRAQFLFPKEINDLIDLAVSDSDELHNARIDRNKALAAGKDASELIAAMRPLRTNVRARFSELAKKMGEEMQLYEVPDTSHVERVNS